MAKRAPGRHRQRSITLAKALLCFGDEAAVGSGSPSRPDGRMLEPLVMEQQEGRIARV